MSNIESISPTMGGSSVSAGSPVENPGAVLDRDAFLKLLVAQLKYQDPTKPADTSQMLAQSAQLTMVDRLNDIADSLQAAESSDKLVLAGSLVGREIAFLAELGQQVTGRVESVRFENGELALSVGGLSVPLGAVSQVFAPALSAPALTPALAPAPTLSPDPTVVTA
jgi:flagellar basal-body rod modification protein FlgD